jgi:hypothetical protein
VQEAFGPAFAEISTIMLDDGARLELVAIGENAAHVRVDDRESSCAGCIVRDNVLAKLVRERLTGDGLTLAPRKWSPRRENDGAR